MNKKVNKQTQVLSPKAISQVSGALSAPQTSPIYAQGPFFTPIGIDYTGMLNNKLLLGITQSQREAGGNFTSFE